MKSVARITIVSLSLMLAITNQAWSQSRATGCNCANASLIGDTVGTRILQNTINSVVGTSVELPGAGPILGAPGPSPRWNIDFGSDSIRIDFVQQAATYGIGSHFTFSSLDPQLAGCPPVFISGITVTTSKPATIFNVAAAATFGPHTVTIPIASNTANLDWQPGEFILVKLKFACDMPPTDVDPCCPPWNQNLLKDMMFYQGSGSISAPYTLAFQPTTAFKNQMQIYINYLHALNPAMTAIAWRLHDEGTGNLPFTYWGTQIPPTAYVSWTWNTTGIGNPVLSPATGFFTQPAYPAFPMQVGTWYAVQTGIYLENGQHFFPDKCAENTIYVRVQVLAAKARGAQVLEISDGKRVIKTVPIQ